MDIMIAVLTIIGAIGGSYLGARWAFRQFVRQQRYEELRDRRDYLRQFLADNYNNIIDFCTLYHEGGRSYEVYDRLIRRTYALDFYFTGDPDFASEIAEVEVSIHVAYNENRQVPSNLDPLTDKLRKLNEQLENFE